jgi:hypothetical protein
VSPSLLVVSLPTADIIHRNQNSSMEVIKELTHAVELKLLGSALTLNKRDVVQLAIL